MKKETLITAIFKIQNRALRAEADLETAIQLLKNADVEVRALTYRAKALQKSVNETHELIDRRTHLPPRRVSHMGLAERVRMLIA